MKEYILMFKNTFKYNGKSSRREYWMAVLFNSIFSMLLYVFALPFINDMLVANTVFIALTSLYEMFVFLPMLSLTIRRLKDAGKSGWWVLIGLLSIVGEIILIVWLCQPSTFRVVTWYDGYKDNPDTIILDDEQKTTEHQTAQYAQNTAKQDSVDKIIQDLNELKQNNQISEQEYNEIMSKLKK